MGKNMEFIIIFFFILYHEYHIKKKKKKVVHLKLYGNEIGIQVMNSSSTYEHVQSINIIGPKFSSQSIIHF